MKLLKLSSISLCMAFVVMGCAQQQSQNDMQDQEQSETEKTEQAMTSSTSYEQAVTVLHPTEGNEVTGTISFQKVAEGVQVQADVQGLEEGNHGFHVHLYGDCTASDGTSAGTHFNFTGSSTNPPADIDRITGNLGNLNAGSDGTATVDTVIANAKLNGPKSILGRAVIIHAKKNDPNQPPIGAAGSRQACGVIGTANSETM
jgi:Cu-Zn family superoxide dismutase